MAEERVFAAKLTGTPEEIERHWFENVYAGDRMPQLTPRAIVMGMLLGMIMACSNVYVGLKVRLEHGRLDHLLHPRVHRSSRRSTALFPKLFPPYTHPREQRACSRAPPRPAR